VTVEQIWLRPDQEDDRPILHDLHRRLSDELARLDAAGATLDQPAVVAQVHELVDGYQREARNRNLPRLLDPAAAAAELIEYQTGDGPLHRYLKRPDIEEISQVGPDLTHLWFVDGHTELVQDVLFDSEEDLVGWVRRKLAPLGRRLDVQNPITEAVLDNGVRLSAILYPISRTGTVVTLRKFPQRFRRIEELIERGMLSWSLARFLLACVAARVNILIGGAMGSGKTTFADVLLCTVPPEERLILIEDPHELTVDQVRRNVVALEARPPNQDHRGAISQSQLLLASLRHRGDRICVGEVRGSEAWPLLRSMLSGHEGSVSTIHCQTPRAAVAMLALLAQLAEPSVAEALAAQWVAQGVQIIVQLGFDRHTRTRYVKSVAEVDGLEPSTNTPRLQELWRSPRPGGPAAWTGEQPHVLAQFAEMGVSYVLPVQPDEAER
jgi:pilus assembly protein CpaF